MTHSLDGARLKVVRAQEHLDTLKSMIARYVASNPYRVNVEDDGDSWDTNIDIISHPDPRLSVIIGDYLTNLRAALDYIMWELCGKSAGRQLDGPPFGKDRPYFPICISPASFQDSLKSLAKYNIPASAIAAIEAVQPYNDWEHPLWLLHLLVNVDKHRLMLVAVGELGSIKVESSSIFGSLVMYTPSFKIQRGDSTIKADTTPNAVSDKKEMYMYSQVTIYVSLKDIPMPEESVERTLENIIKFVADVIPRFDPFFV